MEVNIFLIIILLILIVTISQPVKVFFSQKKLTGKAILNAVASMLMAMGILGFFGSALSSATELGKFIHFEWPVGKADAAIQYTDGTFVVPHEPSGRVQIYDSSLKFIRGWQIQAGGGGFKLNPNKDQTLDVYTFRGRMKYHYDLKGNLLSSKSYSGSIPENHAQLTSVTIPTPIYLWIFTHPFASWGCAVLGALILVSTGQIPVKSRKKCS